MLPASMTTLGSKRDEDGEMTQIADQIDPFRAFSLAYLNSEAKEMTIDELYDEWRLMNPAPVQINDDKNAVSASLRDYRNVI
jgi:hypothetical protein